MLDAQSYINAVSGSLSSPQSTLSGFWKLDQALTGSLHGNADTASTLQTSRNLNGVGFNGSQDITVPLNTTTTTSSGNYYIPFVGSNSSTNQTTYVNGSLYYNPNNGTITANSLSLSGNISANNFSGSSSGTNTGDETASTIKYKLGITTLSGSNTGDQNLSNYVQSNTTPSLSGLYLENSSNPSGDSGSIYWYIAGLSANTVFRTYQRAADNNIVTTYSSNLFGPGNVTTTIYNMDSSGNITTQGNITAYSDITLKDNIINIKDALNKVIQVNGVIYTRKDLEDKQRRYTGVIAQEIEKILPEAVMSDSDGIKSVAYGNLVGLLIEAIKELNDKVDNLQKQLDEKNNDTTNN